MCNICRGGSTASAEPRLLGGLDEIVAVPPGRAVRPEAASSVAPVVVHYRDSLRPCLGTAIAPRRRALFRQTLLVAVSDASEAAPAGGLDAHEVARPQVERGLPRDRLAVHEVAPGGAGLAATRALRSPPAPLADEGQAAILQHAQLAHDAVSAVVETAAARARAQLVPFDAERVGELERLGRR